MGGDDAYMVWAGSTGKGTGTAKKRAKRVARSMKKGAHMSKKSKIWTKVSFRLPKTFALSRTPIALKKGIKKESTWDKYSIVKHPCSSESAIKTIEDQNTLVFIVDKRARKPAIRKAVQDLYSIKVDKVNTLITPKGDKKAYVTLSKAHDALEIANKIGIM